MSKLSPGPWTVQPLQATHGADMAIVAADGAIVTVIEHDPAIQTEEEPDGETVVWSDTDLANAAALAAAEQLMKAGVKLLKAAEVGDADLAMDGYDALRTAIAKAENWKRSR